MAPWSTLAKLVEGSGGRLCVVGGAHPLPGADAAVRHGDFYPGTDRPGQRGDRQASDRYRLSRWTSSIRHDGIELAYRTDKLKMHQPARRVVDEHEQRALRAAVPNHQCSQPSTSTSSPTHSRRWRGWWTLLAPLLAVSPNPGLDHPPPQRFPAQHDLVHLAQLLGRQKPAPAKAGVGPKIPEYCSRMIARLCSEAPRACTGCSHDRAVLKSDPSRPRAGTPPPAGTPGARSSPSSCAAVSTVSRSTSSRVSSPSLISRTDTPNTPDNPRAVSSLIGTRVTF